MNFMAGQTFGHLLVVDVGLMALHTVWNQPMGVMACGARHFGMQARVFLQLVILVGVTGETGIGDAFRKLDVQGGMGIAMAAQTVFEFKMGLSLMAHITLWNDVGGGRRMTLVAVHAADVRFMFFAFAGDGLRSCCVAFNAVIIAQDSIGLGCVASDGPAECDCQRHRRQDLKASSL